ncbi:unnamed protein product, partial [marine sediment metagenome]
NETFGIGGDIDELMEAFMERRRTKMVLQLEFETQTGAPPPASAPEIVTPAGAGGGGHPGGGGFARGGSVVARRPTMALFGEGGPEIAQFTPLSQMNQSASFTKRLEVDINMRGSAPPGVRSTEREQIAGVMVDAMREAGLFATQEG